ncbi:MAG: Ig-like domain-containing protein [Pseudomonadota bacterium]
MASNNHILAAALAAAVTTSATRAEIADNADYEFAYTAFASAFLTLFPTSLLPGPVGAGASLATIALDIGGKTRRAVLITSDPEPAEPNSPDGCLLDFHLPQVKGDYENLFGLADIDDLPTDWGLLATTSPVVRHANAEVELRVTNEYLVDWTPDDRTVVFPSGNHPIEWTAATQLDPVLDVALPVALFYITNQVKYVKAFFELQTSPRTAKRALEIGGLFLINAGVEAGVLSVGFALEDDSACDAGFEERGTCLAAEARGSAFHQQSRSLTVFDVTPPEIAYRPPPGTADPVVLEANSFGGERFEPYRDLFRSYIAAEDPCGEPLLVGNDAPFLLPLGANAITWEARDTGPVGGGNSGVATVIQNVLVQDTRPPILLVPPSRVFESTDPPEPAAVDIGTAVVFDVADPDPEVANTSPAAFPVNARTEVIWTAIDSSGNSDTRSQWITVKAPGSNTPPRVDDASAATLTGQGVEITLSGSDGDFLSGRFDPLMFDIVTPPGDGFFIAPLVPYFIEDLRVRPTDLVGEILNTSNNAVNDLAAAFCGPGDPGVIPVDFVYRPEFVHVTDAGIHFVLDEYFECTGGGNAITRNRISKWSPDGELLDQVDAAAGVERITLDNAGGLYTVTPAGGNATSSPMFLTPLNEDLSRETSFKFTVRSPAAVPSLKSAELDPASGLIYATDRQRLHVYDANDVRNQEPAYVGSLAGGSSFLSGTSVAGSSTAGYTIEVDSEGAVYVSDSDAHRIFKFAPSTWDGQTFTPGAMVGWMGRCDSGPGCDDENGRSFGYSCSATTPCTVTQETGTGPGQFNTPAGMALDPEDILYVTDYDNSRVQRFTPLGDFAGEAASVCDGSCFVLGDMGRPIDISVNATQFFVLDRDRALMHIFETAPFKDIRPDGVVVEYASNNDFQGTDRFTFRASDGLADSNLGTATIAVTRAFRPPEAFDDAVTTDEETRVDVDLLASDPDGIAGIDFNGLDTLTYRIVEGPAHGTLTGTGELRSYTPERDFVGVDQVVFEVDDGRDRSNPAVVDITVNPVNDAPIVRLTGDAKSRMPKAIKGLLEGKIVGSRAQAGLGYPVPLMGEFEDPDFDQDHFLVINWGDGNSDAVGQAPPSDAMAGDEPIITPVVRGVGQFVAEHTWFEGGMKTVNVAVFDNGFGSPFGDAEAEIMLVPMLDLVLEATPESDAPAAPGTMVRLLIDVTNAPPTQPEPGSGLPPLVELPATNVRFTGELPDGVQLLAADGTQGTCRHVGSTTTCDLGTLAPGQVETITVLLLPEPDFDPERLGYVIDVTSPEPDTTGDNLTVVELPVLPQTVFASGFE